ncbi:MlaD family protein [Nocardia huaxiensis]|uniref:MCE family protein n=1 Tax=Nocardia huaxiensis TaxID=2755382 RepID=A0A7D6Z0R8_9NOCA|nr:MlaD family protein [Nocardia huaxiensis]QLY29566.1 MCE family protein [Nocardia huaxiensis]UFS96870.1 MlaD family protein [Nocardia huaxiensis]
MQELTAHDPFAAAAGRRELKYGVLGVIALAALLIATGIIYILPVGKVTYTAELSEARSVQAGDEIRVAGMHVGSVKSLELLADRVRMTFTVDDNVFLGDATSLEVRMLTVVGGHYIAAFPAGERPLGDKAIPMDRVRLPYSLIRTLQDAATPIAQVDGDTLRENFGALQDSLTDSPDALRRMGNAMETLVGLLNRQNTGISQAMSVMDEYLTAINGNRSLIGTFLREIGSLETAGLAKKAEIAESLRICAELLSRIAGIEPAWKSTLEPLADKLAESVPQLEDLGRRFDQAITNLGQIKTRLAGAVTPQDGVVLDQSALTVTAPELCVPLPGKGC